MSLCMYCACVWRGGHAGHTCLKFWHSLLEIVVCSDDQGCASFSLSIQHCPAHTLHCCLNKLCLAWTGVRDVVVMCLSAGVEVKFV